MEKKKLDPVSGCVCDLCYIVVAVRLLIKWINLKAIKKLTYWGVRRWPSYSFLLMNKTKPRTWTPSVHGVGGRSHGCRCHGHDFQNQPQCMLWIVAIGPLVVVVMLHVVVGVGWWWCWCGLLLVHASAGEREGWQTFVETSASNIIIKKIYPNTKKNISKWKGKERKKNLCPNDGEPSFGSFGC